MIVYEKLFQLLEERGMKKTDLLSILSSKTVAKLSKASNLNTDVLNKICMHLKCQPSDIMEYIESETEQAKMQAYEVAIDDLCQRMYSLLEKQAQSSGKTIRELWEEYKAKEEDKKKSSSTYPILKSYIERRIEEEEQI